PAPRLRETHDVEVVAEKRPVASILEQVDVLQVCLDVGALQPEIDQVDERLDLLYDPCRDRALRRAQLDPGLTHHAAQVALKPLRYLDDAEHLAGRQLSLCLLTR